MAAGEYVSVSSQADTERANLDRERRELATQPQAEEDELTAIYVGRGLERDLARRVARQLMANDALIAHARDELGQTEEQAARPLQAAFASAATFQLVRPSRSSPSSSSRPSVVVVTVISLVCLIALGALAGTNGRGLCDRRRRTVGFWARWRWHSPPAWASVFGTAVG